MTVNYGAPVAGSPPSAREVERAHRNSDVDVRKESQHHTIGTESTQAAAGSHRHDGTDAPMLLEGFTITGSRGTATSVGSIIAALVQLGATDSTTA